MEPVSYCKICDVRLPGIDHIKWYYMLYIVNDIGCDDIRHTLSRFLVNIYHNMKYENPSNTCKKCEKGIIGGIWKYNGINSKFPFDIIFKIKQIGDRIIVYKKDDEWFVDIGLLHKVKTYESSSQIVFNILLDNEIGFPWLYKALMKYENIY